VFIKKICLGFSGTFILSVVVTLTLVDDKTAVKTYSADVGGFLPLLERS